MQPGQLLLTQSLITATEILLVRHLPMVLTQVAELITAFSVQTL